MESLSSRQSTNKTNRNPSILGSLSLRDCFSVPFNFPCSLRNVFLSSVLIYITALLLPQLPFFCLQTSLDTLVLSSQLLLFQLPPHSSSQIRSSLLLTIHSCPTLLACSPSFPLKHFLSPLKTQTNTPPPHL